MRLILSPVVSPGYLHGAEDLPVMPINQPSNQIKFTNVSVVRLKKGMHDLVPGGMLLRD